MMKGKKKMNKFIVIILILVLLIISIYVIVNVIQIGNVSIGKTIYLNFKSGDADYLETLLESENANDPNNKVKLLNKEAVEGLIQYMRDNNFKIVLGEYKIPQNSNYEELINILNFELESEISLEQEI